MYKRALRAPCQNKTKRNETKQNNARISTLMSCREIDTSYNKKIQRHNAESGHAFVKSVDLSLIPAEPMPMACRAVNLSGSGTHQPMHCA